MNKYLGLIKYLVNISLQQMTAILLFSSQLGSQSVFLYHKKIIKKHNKILI